MPTITALYLFLYLLIGDETKPENRSMTSRPKRSCTEVKPYYGMSDESDFCSPEESKRPVLNRTPGRTSQKESRTACEFL